MDLDTFRKDVSVKFESIVDNKSEISKKIEQGIYNYAKNYCQKKNIVTNLENEQFKDIYMNKVRNIYSNLLSTSYVNNPRLKDRLLSNEFKPEELAFMDYVQLFPEHWKPLLDEKFTREKALFDFNEGGIVTDQFRCGKCKSKKCTYYELQTRSADEPMTTFVTCLNCGKRWKC